MAYFIRDDEYSLEDTALEEQLLQHWWRKGLCGKLHNVLYYIDASPQRIDRLNDLQLKLMHLQPPEKKPAYAIVKDVITPCNSFDNATKRAVYLRASIDEFCQLEAEDYPGRCRRAECTERSPPRGPSIVGDLLKIDDWTVLGRYHELLEPLQRATTLLQGDVGGNSGCIWQVLPTFEHLLRHFEDKRREYPVPSDALPQLDPTLITSESHFSSACNLGWQKLNNYYAKLDESPVYVAAVYSIQS
ncbi:Hypothetical protein D9617_102g071670 [Elsinoe fawcettii]|nr:Hypothetical protein D9617_102g071670 [Elsinoe fawcettii]